MMRPTLIALVALLFAVFVVASPAPKQQLEPRCSNGKCGSCPDTHFYWQEKDCCLKRNGPSQPPSPPAGKWCPRNWYWHTTYRCCTPKVLPRDNDEPKCDDNNDYKWWDKKNHCCKPNTPTGPNNPTPSSGYNNNNNNNNHGGGGGGWKGRWKSRRQGFCPSGLTTCAIPGTGDFECIDVSTDVSSCGGCIGTGGQNCSAIPNAWNVSCDGSCHVLTCAPGWHVSPNGKSCVHN